MALKIKNNSIEPVDNAVGYDASFGTFSSAAAVAGNKIDSSKTKKVDICADDGGANFGTTDVRTMRVRTLLTAAQSGSASIAGLMGQLKNTAADTTTGHKCGVKGYYEAVSGATVATTSAGVMAMLDVPSGATIASGGASGLNITSVDLGGTHTGKATAIGVENAGAGSWDGFLSLPSTSSQVIQSGAATGGTSQYLKVYIGGTLYTILMTTA